jgi:hypothetical protein
VAAVVAPRVALPARAGLVAPPRAAARRAAAFAVLVFLTLVLAGWRYAPLITTAALAVRLARAAPAALAPPALPSAILTALVGISALVVPASFARTRVAVRVRARAAMGGAPRGVATAQGFATAAVAASLGVL